MESFEEVNKIRAEILGFIKEYKENPAILVEASKTVKTHEKHKNMDKKELQWGETPFDSLTKEELLRLCQKMWTTIDSLASVTRMRKAAEEHYQPNHPYWGKNGSGGSALEMARQIQEPITNEYESENIYRSFFRYARDLLFEDTGYRIGAGWAVCPVCGVMYGVSGSDRQSSVGQKCQESELNKDCDGVMRELQWEDLSPK